jgi:nicotinate dehydrogenase subunit A
MSIVGQGDLIGSSFESPRHMSEAVTLTVNGQLQTIYSPGSTPLLTVLRNELGLTAARFGCGLEQCGACKVLVNGEAVPSCQLAVSEVAGSRVRTLEDLSDGDTLDPIQQAFLDEQAAQCGFCTAGLIIAVKSLLDHNPDPSDSEVREALKVHVCRCGVHHRILRAVHRAAKALSR